MRETIALVSFCVPYYYLYLFFSCLIYLVPLLSIEFQFYIYCAIEQIYLCFGMRRSWIARYYLASVDILWILLQLYEFKKNTPMFCIFFILGPQIHGDGPGGITQSSMIFANVSYRACNSLNTLSMYFLVAFEPLQSGISSYLGGQKLSSQFLTKNEKVCRLDSTLGYNHAHWPCSCMRELPICWPSNNMRSMQNTDSM